MQAKKVLHKFNYMVRKNAKVRKRENCVKPEQQNEKGKPSLSLNFHCEAIQYPAPQRVSEHRFYHSEFYFPEGERERY